MRLSAPIHRLKHRAKILARQKSIPLNKALDRIAADEGFSSWSLLAAKAKITVPTRDLLAALAPGDLVLLGARPGHGKTLMGLMLIVEAITSGREGAFFTFEYNDADIQKHLGVSDAVSLSDRFTFDNSDNINADYIVARLAAAARGTVVVVDYLQLLDQKRENPPLMTQIRALKEFAAKRGLIIVFISQIDRSYETSNKPIPSLEDVRLPNPLDLSLFDKTCFLNDGKIRIEALH